MNAQMSSFLISAKPELKRLVALLESRFDYASVLGTDVSGRTCEVRDKSSAVMDYSLAERGFCVRVYRFGSYFEYSFNDLSQGADKIAQTIKRRADKAASAPNRIAVPRIQEEGITECFYGSVDIPPDAMTSAEKLEKLRQINAYAHSLSTELVDFACRYVSAQVSKMFVSTKKDLEQSYIWSEAIAIAFVRRGDASKSAYASASGMKGLEILDELGGAAKKAVEHAAALLDAKPMPPGEYEVVFGPGAAGLIAHEAFGHGVEMDMFVKNRARAEEYMNKPVASAIVNMRDGAKSAVHAGSFLFDDEGTIGSDTVIIQNGVLVSGISDALSALTLGTKPTGNGRRESYKSKVYTRMTNTFFAEGSSKLEDMIAGIKYGFFVEDGESGMEDPKDWGIQCQFECAKEIVDGKLTGRIFAPVVLTGYVPELLSNITAVSEGCVELDGTGYCGKGYKEYVKVSTGGTYIKTKARLG